MTEITVELTQPARKSGGDKYEATTGVNFNIYVPQVISRANTGHPAEKLLITISEV